MTKSEDKVFAELFLDLKGRKRKRLDWMSIAEKCKSLLNDRNSPSEVAEKLGVSPALFRAILSLNDLPPVVKNMVRRRELLMDSAQRLNSIESNELQVKVAKLVLDMSNKKQREVILHASRYPDSDIEDIAKRVKAGGVEKTKLRMVIVPLQEELYHSFSRTMKSKRKSLDEVFPEMVEDWVKRNGGSI